MQCLSLFYESFQLVVDYIVLASILWLLSVKKVNTEFTCAVNCTSVTALYLVTLAQLKHQDQDQGAAKA